MKLPWPLHKSKFVSKQLAEIRSCRLTPKATFSTSMYITKINSSLPLKPLLRSPTTRARCKHHALAWCAFLICIQRCLLWLLNVVHLMRRSVWLRSKLFWRLGLVMVLLDSFGCEFFVTLQFQHFVLNITTTMARNGMAKLNHVNYL